jgi:hypothetical protein
LRTHICYHRYVDILFREERLPVAEGWTKSTTQITLGNIRPLMANVSAASQWVPDSTEEDSEMIVVGTLDGITSAI